MHIDMNRLQWPSRNQRLALFFFIRKQIPDFQYFFFFFLPLFPCWQKFLFTGQKEAEVGAAHMVGFYCTSESETRPRVFFRVFSWISIDTKLLLLFLKLRVWVGFNLDVFVSCDLAVADKGKKKRANMPFQFSNILYTLDADCIGGI